jgi:hypothetical protein
MSHENMRVRLSQRNFLITARHFNKDIFIKHSYIASIHRLDVTLWRCAVRTSVGTSTTTTQVFIYYPQFLQASSRRVPQIGHDRLLPNLFKYVSYYTFDDIVLIKKSIIK